ncbi:hypothetical protein PG997_005761 [Apiospora hydei]|uniref:Heterokaryon incompatibility domain-containing protein n=1 Tax=Apiospora hydei TaxID=1337664 RepID=A0ABR1WLS0_9PEZI
MQSSQLFPLPPLSLNVNLDRVRLQYYTRATCQGHVLALKHRNGGETRTGVDFGMSQDPSYIARCHLLDLSAERFTIGTRSTATPYEWQSSRPPEPGHILRINSGSVFKDFASLKELRGSMPSCSFCKLLCLAIKRYGSGDTDDSTTCSLSWELDRRQDEDPGSAESAHSSRRIRLSWNEANGNVQVVYVVLVPPQSSTPSAACSSWQPISQPNAPSQQSDTKADTDVQALIEAWVGTCLQKHQGSCDATHNSTEEFKSLVEETYFGVIDVVDMQLKELPMEDGRPDPYVALSYVWGQEIRGNSDYVSTRATVMKYITPGGLQQVWERLPQTIQDSILLVRRLGCRYLWIDAFCIVQDSGSSWKLNSEAMHLIYGNALFTICAADGDGCSAGLRAAWPMLWPDNSDGDPAEPTKSDADPIRVECTPGMWLTVTRPLETVVDSSIWNTRAWTFQERILSRRCLIFAEGRVYYQCRVNRISQDTYTNAKNNESSFGRTHSSIQPLGDIQQRPIWCYMKYVSMYTGRNLTKAGDILAAFGGISWLLGRYMRAPLLFNLPISHFDLALLWSPTQPIKMRRPHKEANSATKGCAQDSMGNCLCQRSHSSGEDKTFPTWSWSGWEGERLDSGDGCLSDIRGWLKHHTWIQWYVRNEKGHLRPLWETMQRPNNLGQPPAHGFDLRWQGYGSRSETQKQLMRQLSFTLKELETGIRHNLAEDDRVRIGNDLYFKEDCQEEVPYSDQGEDGFMHARLPYKDRYDRLIPHEVPRADDTMFKSILPDNPFGVIRDTSIGKTEADSRYMPILQFYTWRAWLHVAVRDEEAAGGNNASRTGTGSGAGEETTTEKIGTDTSSRERDILDENGDWCGSVVLDDPSIPFQPSEPGNKLSPFIALSDAKAFTARECPAWDYDHHDRIPEGRRGCTTGMIHGICITSSGRREAAVGETGAWEGVQDGVSGQGVG